MSEKCLEISVCQMFENFKEKERESYFLIDVRSYEERIIDGFIECDDLFRPIELLFQDFSDIPLDKTIIFYCRSGVRSLVAANFFEEKKIFKKNLSLSGGILEYKRKFKE
jgi:adenylyltransferase/sulfurtransferase